MIFGKAALFAVACELGAIRRRCVVRTRAGSTARSAARTAWHFRWRTTCRPIPPRRLMTLAADGVARDGARLSCRRLTRMPRRRASMRAVAFARFSPRRFDRLHEHERAHCRTAGRHRLAHMGQADRRLAGRRVPDPAVVHAEYSAFTTTSPHLKRGR